MFIILNEQTEDTFESNNLEEAISLAKEMVKQCKTGDLVCILDNNTGRSIKQFVLLDNGNIKENIIDENYLIKLHKCITINSCGIPDSLIDSMSEKDLKEKLKEIRNVALWWASQKGDDRCWLDDLKLLQAILPKGCVHFEMPKDLDFIQNCIKFKQTRCPKNLKLHEW